MAETKSPSPNENLSVLFITRTFRVPRELVYEAFTNPEHTKQWMGPRSFIASHHEQDVRPGGKWRTCLHQVAEWNGRLIPDLWQGGVYKEVVPPERLVYTFAWDGEAGQPTRETVVTIVFTEIDTNNTRMDFYQAFFDSIEQRDGHNQGWNSGFDRLDEFLVTPALTKN